MKELVKVIIPSHRRADKVLTKDAVANCALCVEESQEAEYRKHNPDMEIIVHPDTVIGYAPKIQWILDQFDEGDIFILNDDLKSMKRMYTGPGVEAKVDPLTAYELIQACAATAMNLGAYLFGFTKNQKPLMYNSQKPLSLSGYVIGGWCGILKGSKLFLPTDHRFTAVDDYWLSGLNAFHHRYAFIDNRFSFNTTDIFTGEGGFSGIRTLETERKDTLFLRDMFGDAIQIKKPTAQRKRLVQPYERTLYVPY